MKNFQLKDDFEKDSSWISISSLKKAAKISTVFEKVQTENTLPVNLTTSSDWRPFEKLSESTSCNTFEFCRSSKLKIPKPSDLLKQIERLNEEISILSQQLKLSNKEIEKLNNHIAQIHKENTIKVQFMQEQHEKRLQKSKLNIDFLLKDLSLKSAALIAQEFLQKHAEEIENLKSFYETEIAELKNNHEGQILVKEIEKEKTVNDLKKRFFRYINEIEKKFKNELACVKYECNKEISEISKEICETSKENSNRDYRSFDQTTEDEITIGLDYEGDFARVAGKGEDLKKKLGIKLAIGDIFERFSCESCASTRRDSR